MKQNQKSLILEEQEVKEKTRASILYRNTCSNSSNVGSFFVFSQVIDAVF